MLATAIVAIAIVEVFRGGGGGGGPAATGGPQARWTFKTGGFVGSSPAVVDGRVFFGSQNQDVYALDATTGTQSWNFETGKIVFSSPAVATGVVYVGSHDHNVYALDARTGKMRWRFETGKLVKQADGAVLVRAGAALGARDPRRPLAAIGSARAGDHGPAARQRESLCRRRRRMLRFQLNEDEWRPPEVRAPISHGSLESGGHRG